MAKKGKVRFGKIERVVPPPTTPAKGARDVDKALRGNKAGVMQGKRRGPKSRRQMSEA